MKYLLIIGDGSIAKKHSAVIKRIFKDNVIIKKNDMTLFSDNATYIPDSNKVILIDNVKMYSGQDSLECNNLVLYDKIDKEFIAEGDVNFYKINQLIKCEYLDYKESLKGKNLIQNFTILNMCP